MIKAIIGGVGSGKTLTAVKYIIDQDRSVYCNFPVKKKGVHRLKVSDIIESRQEVSPRGKITEKLAINWEFWEKVRHKDFDIVLDEVHNVVNARRAMSKRNVLITEWFSQIRKILGDNKENHIVLISQRLERIDIAFRDLVHEIIYCEAKTVQKYRKWPIAATYGATVLPETWIFLHKFVGTYAVDKYVAFLNGQKSYDAKTYYLGNYYYKYYDTYGFVRFGESVYL